MIMNPAMLFFGLIDSGVAFFLVYYIVKARFGGNQKAIARILAALLGTIVFSLYFATITWFNTATYSTSQEVKNLVYAAPFIFAILITTLVILSQPPKEENAEQTDEVAADNAEEGAEEVQPE